MVDGTMDMGQRQVRTRHIHLNLMEGSIIGCAEDGGGSDEPVHQ